MSAPELAPTAETVVRVAAGSAAGGSVLDRELRAARRRVEAGDLAGEAVEEALLQGYLFLGFPATLEGLAAWRALGSPGPAAPTEEDPEARVRRGRRLCRRVYGDAYDDLRANVRALHPDLDRWMVEEGYGKVLSRPGLDAVTRELCVVATLAVTGWPRQLHSHLRGALNVGAGPGDVERALDLAADVVDDRLEEAHDLWRRVRDRVGEASCS